jgi:hypothetical protein
MEEWEQKVEQADSCLAPSGKNISGEHWRFCLQCGYELIMKSASCVVRAAIIL